MIAYRIVTVTVTLLAFLLFLQPAHAQSSITPAEARAIAREAYIYGFPMVTSYRIQYDYFVDRTSPEFKAPWNRIHNTARVCTPDDQTIQMPSADTPYSMLGLDLRAEPVVLSVPDIEKGRYYSIQLIDAYTHNFAYIGSRETGNDGGSFLVAGPGWKGPQPKGIKAVIQCETELALAMYRTHLLNPDDLENVKKIQAGYRVQTLSEFLGRVGPAAAPKIDFIKPLSPGEERTSLEFFDILNFVLRFCPPVPSEAGLRERFARLGITAGQRFDPAALSPEIREAIEAGIADALEAFDELMNQIDTGEVKMEDLSGNREFFQDRYLYRMAGAEEAANSKEEAIYRVYLRDADGRMLEASRYRYTLRFAPDQLPPVNAFWSVTMYELPACLLSANPINRYLINSPMLPGLQRDADGGLTIYMQHDSPGRDKEANWLPAPQSHFCAVLRLYWPGPEALNGTWKEPPLNRSER